MGLLGQRELFGVQTRGPTFKPHLAPKACNSSIMFSDLFPWLAKTIATAARPQSQSLVCVTCSTGTAGCGMSDVCNVPNSTLAVYYK